jgi:hypothetical protein
LHQRAELIDLAIRQNQLFGLLIGKGNGIRPPGGISFGVWVKLRLTVSTPDGDTACCELITTKQLADPQDASAEECIPHTIMKASKAYGAARRISVDGLTRPQ